MHLPDWRPLPVLWAAIQSFHSHRELGACMRSIYANRNSKGDFLLNELERWANRGLSVYIASAFFTDAEVVEKLLYKGCSVYMVVRLGFPTSPDAIDRVRKHPNMNLRVYTSRTFHPKLYILGDEEALVGSANLTRSALVTNQEVVVHIDQHDDCLQDLVSIFDDYWAGATVPTDSELAAYRDFYRQYSKLDHEIGALEQNVLGVLGETSPANIDRSEAKKDVRSAFIDGFRRSYQETTSAFNVVRRIYEASGYRKISEEKIPLRIEIDSFLSYVRETAASGDSWASAPLRSETEQRSMLEPLIEAWSRTPWPHFEGRIVADNYPRLKSIFSTEDSISKADDSELFDALATLHSFHDRFRFFEGGLPTWKKQFPSFNDPAKTRKTLAYIVHGRGDIVERMANAIYSPKFKLNEFGRANVQELVGWTNRDELPIINGRTTKVLRYFGARVSQVG